MITKPTQEVRVRIAPSPTGNFHVGTAHTALFNWLFARHNGGKFVLRIEDTDRERSKFEYEKNIIAGLRWLGITWDEGPDIGGPHGPYRQTERLNLYETHIATLLAKDAAYYCTCTAEELEAERARMTANGVAPRYSGKCRAKNAKTGPGVIRFKIPEQTIAFTDIIRGELTFDGALIGDIVIAKSPREPLYNFAVVVDDADMCISHVIRGEEHIANTPRQLFIQEALGIPRPQYAHLPLMLDKQRAKLSKRTGSTGVDEYRKDGYLPEAIVNFLALMGWHPTDDREVLRVPDMIKEFSLERVQKAGAAFDVEKLRWLNAQYIRATDEPSLLKTLNDLYPEFTAYRDRFDAEKLCSIIALTKGRLHTLREFLDAARLFFEPDAYDPALLVWKKSTASDARECLTAAREAIENLKAPFTNEYLEQTLAPVTDARGRGEVLWPLRVALSGRDASPGPYDMMRIIGKDETLRRIDTAIQKL